MRTCLFFGLLNLREQGIFDELGAEQVIRPQSQNGANRKLQKIKPLHQLLFFGRTGPATPENRGCNAAEEAASLNGAGKVVAPKQAMSW